MRAFRTVDETIELVMGVIIGTAATLSNLPLAEVTAEIERRIERARLAPVGEAPFADALPEYEALLALLRGAAGMAKVADEMRAAADARKVP